MCGLTSISEQMSSVLTFLLHAPSGNVFFTFVHMLLCFTGRKRKGDYGDDSGEGSEGEEGPIKCAACNRSTQDPDMQVSSAQEEHQMQTVY